MSSEEDFDNAAYKEYEDHLYQEESSSGSEDDLDSEIEEALYSQVHYASSLLVPGSSTPGDKKTPTKANLADGGVTVRGPQKGNTDKSLIEISSDDDGDDDDDDDDCNDDDNDDSNNGTDDDSVKCIEVCSDSKEYPEVINIFSDDNNPSSIEKTPEVAVVQDTEEPGEITENWDLSEKDLGDSNVVKQRPRYYTPGKKLPHMRCYNCNEKGHLSEFCPEPKKISVCFLCGCAGHMRRNCPNELCFNCHEPGHISKQCRKPRVRPFDRCKRCHVLGHLANDCPDRWRQYHLTTEVGPLVRPTRAVSPPQSVSCYNCGHQGHYGHECREENSLRKGELPLPFVVRYDGCDLSSSRGIKNNNKRKPERRPRDQRIHQRYSEGIYDWPTQEDYDMERRLTPQATKEDYDMDGRLAPQATNEDYDMDERLAPQATNEDYDMDERLAPQATNEDYDMDERLAPQAFQEHYDMDERLKIQKANYSEDIRRVSFDDESYQFNEYNARYTDRILPKRKKKQKNKRRDETGCTERVVELLDPSPGDEGLIEEPYQGKRKKAKKRKQWQHEDRFDNNSRNFVARKKFKQQNDREYTNSHRNKDFRSFEKKDFDARTSPHPRKGHKEFVSNRGFRFNDQTGKKKSKPQFFKRYTF